MSGRVSLGETQTKELPAALPAYSTDTLARAEALVVAACETNADGSFFSPEVFQTGELEELYEFGHRLEKLDTEVLARQKGV